MLMKQLKMINGEVVEEEEVGAALDKLKERKEEMERLRLEEEEKVRLEEEERRNLEEQNKMKEEN